MFISSISPLLSTDLSPRKTDIAQHFTNACDYGEHATVQAHVCDVLVTKTINAHQGGVLEIGAGQGQLSQKLVANITANNWHVNELCQAHFTQLRTINPMAKIHIGDGERLKPTYFNEKFSLIASANAVQWFDNPLGFIEQSAHLLKEKGQLLFNTFTPNNFKQIKQLTGQGLDYPTTEQWQDELIQQGFNIHELSVHQYDITFASPYDVLRHVKKTGVSVNVNDSDSNNSSAKSFRWTKSSLAKFTADYVELFSNDNGEVMLSYEVLVVSAVKGIR